MRKKSNHPVICVILPYLTAVLGLALLSENMLGKGSFFLAIAPACLVFYPYWNSLVYRWLRRMEKSGANKAEVLRQIKTFGLDCGDLGLRE